MYRIFHSFKPFKPFNFCFYIYLEKEREKEEEEDGLEEASFESLGFSQLFRENVTDEQIGDLSLESVEDYGLRALFKEEKVSKENYDFPIGLLSMKTSTLVILFCVSVTMGIYVGNGKIEIYTTKITFLRLVFKNNVFATGIVTTVFESIHLF